MNLIEWLNAQLLRMEWLSSLMRTFVENGLGLDTESPIGGSIHFFLYDVLKIFILLSALIFVISYVQSFFPPERTRRIAGSLSGVWANVAAALLGTVTPFCSCSSIPLFIGFTGAGLPLGVTFSFLISSPLVDLASVILLASVFNWATALAYVVVGVLLAVIGGTLIAHARLERYVEPFVFQARIASITPVEMSVRDRLAFAREQVAEIARRVWLYVLIGVGIGALIHNWIPADLIKALLGEGNRWSVPVATLIGVPMYADIFGTLPIAEALVSKGSGLGTALAFMMAVTALSLPSFVMLKKVVRMPLLLVFTLIVVSGILLIGYAFNALEFLLI